VHPSTAGCTKRDTWRRPEAATRSHKLKGLHYTGPRSRQALNGRAEAVADLTERRCGGRKGAEYVRLKCPPAGRRGFPQRRGRWRARGSETEGPGGVIECPRIHAATLTAGTEAVRLLAHRRRVERSAGSGAKRRPLSIDGIENRQFLRRCRRMSTACQCGNYAQGGGESDSACERPAVHGGLLLQDIELAVKVRLASGHRQTINGHGMRDGFSARRRFVRRIDA
jgi:hypothetical protein